MVGYNGTEELESIIVGIFELPLGAGAAALFARSPQDHAQAYVGEGCKQAGLLIGKGGLYGNVLRIAPPLTVTNDEIDNAGEIISRVIGSLS